MSTCLRDVRSTRAAAFKICPSYSHHTRSWNGSHLQALRSSPMLRHPNTSHFNINIIHIYYILYYIYVHMHDTYARASKVPVRDGLVPALQPGQIVASLLRPPNAHVYRNPAKLTALLAVALQMDQNGLKVTASLDRTLKPPQKQKGVHALSGSPELNTDSGGPPLYNRQAAAGPKKGTLNVRSADDTATTRPGILH